MRNLIMCIILLVGILVLLTGISHAQNFKIYKSDTGDSLNLQQLAQELTLFDVIFFGEAHDDTIIHQLEAEILPLLAENGKIAISMEMFERDVQAVVDSFLGDEISEDEFIRNSRAWPNYPTDYKPIVDFAKAHELPVIAANIPRKYAAMFARGDLPSLYNLTPEERKFMANQIMILDDEYKERFIESMKGHSMGDSTGMMKMKMDYGAYYAAQCIKDDTMAESIARFWEENPETHIIHYNGYFHSNGHLGTAQKLQILRPELFIAVIAPIFVEEGESMAFPVDEKNEGDFLLVKYYQE